MSDGGHAAHCVHCGRDKARQVLHGMRGMASAIPRCHARRTLTGCHSVSPTSNKPCPRAPVSSRDEAADACIISRPDVSAPTHDQTAARRFRSRGGGGDLQALSAGNCRVGGGASSEPKGEGGRAGVRLARRVID